MRLPLVWRLVAPTLVVSVLLLMVGLGAALYVYLWNAQVAIDLDRRLSAVLAAEELVLAIRDLRVELDRYINSQDEQFLVQAKVAASTAADRIATAQRYTFEGEEQRTVRLKSYVDDLVGQVNAFSQPRPDAVETVRRHINQSALPSAEELLLHNRIAVADESRNNRRVAGLVGTSLALLGMCGAAAGLLAGYGMARSIARSIEQLGGSLQTIAQTLADEPEHVRSDDGLRDLITTMGRISERTAGVVSELEQSRESAVRTDQLAAVGQLAAGIAHELRNPLTAVKLLVDTAVEQNQPLPDADLAVVQEEIGRMETLLRSFLDFARPPKLHRQPTDLSQVASQAVELVRPRAAVQHVSIDCETMGPIVASADWQQIRQVVVNVLMNAVDAMSGGGEIHVEVVETEIDNTTYCVVRITDTGPGIPPEMAYRLFEPFFSTKETGVGLGLTICRRIVDSHGGTIKVGNAPGRGAQFSISIPAEAVAAMKES